MVVGIPNAHTIGSINRSVEPLSPQSILAFSDNLDIGVITSVGKMHLSTFKTYKRLVDSKCEIDLLVKEKGILFIKQVILYFI